jgi:hypothetical protein
MFHPGAESATAVLRVDRHVHRPAHDPEDQAGREATGTVLRSRLRAGRCAVITQETGTQVPGAGGAVRLMTG